MSDSYAKYIEDQQDYEVLCKKYKETVVMEKDYPWGADCYGDHSYKLKERSLKEWRESND